MTNEEIEILVMHRFFNQSYWKKLTIKEIIKFSIKNAIDLSSNKKTVKSIKTKTSKEILFSESEIFDKKKFSAQFSDWPKEKLKYYWQSADTWSSEGNKKVDWIRTISTWERRDSAEGKLKFKEEIKEEPDNFFANR